MSQQKIVLQPLLRVWLGLFSGLLLVSAISAFHGKYWYFGDKQALYAAHAGENPLRCYRQPDPAAALAAAG
ncbi:hypothetical protein NUBL17186_46470 [Klebsiella quasipneumoniae]|nr:hypothetical protein NUBL17186_46470 [Klebsiella quasipneumoniae]